MAAKSSSVNGMRKAAIMTVLMGEELSAEVIKHLHEDEVERLAREMATLGPVSPQLSELVLEEFHDSAYSGEFENRGDIDYARRVLRRALGEQDSRRVLDRVHRSYQSSAGFHSIERADPEQLSKFILGEHPQTIALILAHLKPGNAAHLVTQLPDSLRADVLTRMASLDDISPEVIARISTVIEQRLKTLGGPLREQHGGVRAVAELFNQLERQVSAPVLEAIEQEKPELAVSIRNLMFVFDDFVTIDDNGIREIVQRADKKALTVALKGASEELREQFFKNMSKRASQMIKEEMDVLGAVRLREVERAQQEIVAIARKLEEEGIIVTGAAAGEAYVV